MINFNESIVKFHKEQPKRTALSASRWSHCDRAMWYEFRGASEYSTKPETIRTFAFGHAIEELIVKWIELAGIKVHLRQGVMKASNGTYIGSIDGVVVLDGVPHLLEVKSSASKYYKAWLKDGAPEKYKAQASIYMHHSNQLSKKNERLQKCLFVVMNKDTSEIHTEVFEYNAGYAALQTDRIIGVSELEEVPPKDESYMCNMCRHRAVCNESKFPEIVCGTCCNVDCENGVLSCKFGTEPCFRHVLHPQLVEGIGYELKSIDAETGIINYDKFSMADSLHTVDGVVTYDSVELKKALETGLFNDPVVEELKKSMGAKIVQAEKLSN